MKKSSHGGGSKFTASALAGILAVGMVPAAAFAEDVVDDTTDEAAIEEVAVEEASIELEATAVAEFNNGSAIAAKIGDVTYTEAQIKAGIEVEATGSAISPEITKVRMEGGQEVEVSTAKKFAYTYFADTDEDGIYTAGKDQSATPTAAGTYFVVATGGSGAVDGDGESLVGGAVAMKFTIKAKSLDAAKPWNSYDSNEDVSKKDFFYAGADIKGEIQFEIDGKTLVKGTDYDVAYFVKGGSSTTSIINAGSYYAELTGKAEYAGAKATIEFAVAPLDISKTDWYIKDVQGTAPEKTAVLTDNTDQATSGTAGQAINATLQGLLNFAITGYPTSTQTFSATGKYTATVTVNDKAEGASNVTGTKTITFSNFTTAGAIRSDAQDGTNSRMSETKAGAATISVNKASTDKNAKKDFDIESITLTTKETDPDDDAEIASATFEYEVTDAEGNVVASDLASATAKLKEYGTWTLKVTGTSPDKKTIATGYVIVDVKADSVAAATNVFFQYKAGTQTVKNLKNSTTTHLPYDGTDKLADITIKVKDSKGADVAASDYKVEVTKSGTKVDSIKDAGEYVITVTSDKIKFSDTNQNKTTVTVDPLALTGDDTNKANNNLRVAGVEGDYSNGAPVYMLRYTGAALSPSFEYGYNDDKGTTDTKDDKTVWTALPTEAYKIASIADKDGKTVTEIKNAGTYTVTLAAGSDATAAGNFGFSASPVVKILVSESSFVDVPGTSWSAEYVNDINENGWMTGYSDGTHFGPKDNMKRGDVCLVMYRMATGTDGKDVPNAPANTFSDVKEGSYWEDAIAWAADAGIVTGYSGKDAGKFGPSDSVTREQFVLMMARYAKYQNVDTKSDGKAMATKKDPQKVSSWAKDAVAWGVDGDMIGSNGTIDPQGKITREQIAKIVMVFAENNEKAVKAVTAAPATVQYAAGAKDAALITVSDENAAKGATVKVNAISKDTSKTLTVTVKSGTTTIVTKSNSGSKTDPVDLDFLMPEGGVTIEATLAS